MSNKNLDVDKFKQLVRDLEKIAETILHDAIRDEMEHYGSWEVGVNTGRFRDEIADKHNIQLVNIELGDNMELDFRMRGDLEHLFRSYRISPAMHATVQNSGNDYVTFKDATDLELDLDSPSLSIGYELTQGYFDRVAALHEEMTKKYMFALLKR